MELESAVRIAAFNWLTEQKRIYGDILPRKILEKGFDFRDNQISLVSPQGIFRPKILNYPLTITTAPDGPYEDIDNKNGLITYRYRGQDPNHRDNVGLRNMISKQVPLIYLFGIEPGKYQAEYPVYIVQDNIKELYFTVAVDAIGKNDGFPDAVAEARREYVTGEYKRRLHQYIFRSRVLRAYSTQCSFCNLRHDELLDAAHIIPDSEPEGKPIITNGLALCKIHHAAFDSYFIGVTPDYNIQIRHDILDEKDGPMLQYGIKELHGKTLILPKEEKHFPKKENLEWRFDRFQKAGVTAL